MGGKISHGRRAPGWCCLTLKREKKGELAKRGESAGCFPYSLRPARKGKETFLQEHPFRNTLNQCKRKDV